MYFSFLSFLSSLTLSYLFTVSIICLADLPIVISIETRFSNTSRFAHHAHTTDAFISQCDAKAVAMNLSHPFVYLNYASEKQAQDVYRGYGNESLELLRSVSEKFDPQNVFGRLKAGPFKF